MKKETKNVMKNKISNGEAVLEKNFSFENGREKVDEIKEKFSKFFNGDKLSEFCNNFRGNGPLILLEGGDKAWKVFEKYLDFKAEVTNRIVPAASKFITGFVFPAHLGRIIDGVVEKGTKTATFLGKNFSKISTNAFLLGAPAWIDALRRNIAISDSNNNYKKAETSQELLQESFINSLEEESIRDDMKNYCELRSELESLRENPTENEERLSEISKDISLFELRYKDNLDFTNLKNVFAGEKSFFEENEIFLDDLANKTAEEMILNVENYYKKKIGKSAGKVEGKWSEIASDKEKGREELVKKISERLRVIMKNNIESDFKQELKKIEKELVNSFGGYRKYMKAAMYTMLGALPLAKIGLDKMGAWEPIAEKIQEGKDYVGEKLSPIMQWLHGEFDELKNNGQEWLIGKMKDYIKEKSGEALDSVKETAREKLADKTESTVGAITKLADFLGYSKGK